MLSLRFMIPAISALALSAFCTANTTAQDAAPAAKGLTVGGTVPGPFRMFVVSDERFEKNNPNVRKDKVHCFICEAELNPTIMIFSRTEASATAPGAKAAKEFNELVNTFRAEKLGVYVAFINLAKEYQLEDDRDAKADKVRDLAGQLKTTNIPFGLAAGKSEATDLYGIQETDDTVIVFFDRLRVVKVARFTADKPPSDAELKEFAEVVKKQLKK
jgi:hypothetical protein